MATRAYQFPRIGVNPLSEYIAATPLRRASIIRQAKTPPVYIVKKYNLAEDFLAHYLSIEEDPRYLKEYIANLRKGPYKNAFEQECGQFSADALDGFLKTGKSLQEQLQQYTRNAVVNEYANKMTLSGVQISFRPEVLIMAPSGKQQVGFVKFYFSKTTPLNEGAAKVTACLGKHYFQKEHDLSLQRDLCIVHDVFRGLWVPAPKAELSHLKNIKAACQEIADRWDIFS